MKLRILLPLLASMLVFTGCLVTSVYPFYAQKDVLFEPSLLGNWLDSSNADEHWKFETNGPNAYRMTYTTRTATNVMQATFFKLQSHAFLDLSNSEINDDTQPPPIPSHFLFRINQTTPILKMAAMDYEWLVGTLTNTPGALRHHWAQMGDDPEKKRLVLTADTAELQRFVLKQLNNTNAWDTPGELTRPAPTPKPSGP
jgi:hypothetical protein